MKRCLGPCVSGLTTVEVYTEAVEHAQMFLAGRSDELVRRLRREMRRAAHALEYERAARIRDTLGEIEILRGRQNLSSVRGEDVDVYGFHLAGGNAAVVALVMRGGHVLDRREMFWEGESNVDPSRLLSELLPQLYDRTTFIPKEVHLPVPVSGDEALERWLSDRKGERVYLRFPARGPKARRVELAMRNAKLAHRRRFRGEAAGDERPAALATLLGLPDPPRRIEGLDISHFQGDETMASLVVWEAGRMRKSDYRIFKIRGLSQADDFAAIHQAVSRRYRRVLEETGSLPDLILIDGGRGQLNAALSALAELGVEETPIVALAKREEEIYLPERPEPLRSSRRNAGLKLLQAVRDEAHRFAVDRHRRRRRKQTLVSRLDGLTGIGPRRKRTLLQRFGSLRGVRAATREELQEVLGGVLGASVFDELRRSGADRPGPDPVAGEESPGGGARVSR
jgi:excinuclease ABC subunit C